MGYILIFKIINKQKVRMPYKRKSMSSYNYRAKRARKTGSYLQGRINLGKRTIQQVRSRRSSNLTSRVNNLYKMIETKECTHKVESGLAVGDRYLLYHNNPYVLGIEPFKLAQGAGDAMGEGVQVNRIGDRITVRGLMIRGQVETAQLRPKVYFRIMLIKAAKGDTIDRTTLFKNNCSNKMLDQVNTERFTILAQRVMNVRVDNGQAGIWNNVSVNGEVNDSGRGGIGTKNFSIWVPGSKIIKDGNMQFENNGFQPKFFDYKIVCLAYDHVATAQDVNQILQINCVYTKCYFKDA